MSPTALKPISIIVSDTTHVSGLLQNPPAARACYVLAHGAGAGMDHPFMENVKRARVARHCHVALSVSLHGARQQTARPNAARADNGPFRRSSGAPAVA